MYFSVITPQSGYERDAAHERVRGAYGEHQWLWNFLPAPQGTDRDFLFRRSDAAAMPRYYVVSKRPPQAVGPAWNVQTREYAPRLEAGDHLHFDLRANPVVTLSHEGKSKRHDVVMQEKKRLLQDRGLARWDDWRGEDKPSLYSIARLVCGKWLDDRAQRLGFQVRQESLSVDAYQQHRGKKDSLRFSTVDYSGELKVIDPLLFNAALCQGIGHAKAFGCGLLLVRRLG